MVAWVYSSHLSTEPMMSGSWWLHSTQRISCGCMCRDRASTSGL